jgi:ribosomal protein S21
MGVKIVLHEGEDIDSALARFKRAVNKSDILFECRKRESYLTKGLLLKMKKDYKIRKK